MLWLIQLATLLSLQPGRQRVFELTQGIHVSMNTLNFPDSLVLTDLPTFEAGEAGMQKWRVLSLAPRCLQNSFWGKEP